jgi:hypothetical protein
VEVNLYFQSQRITEPNQSDRAVAATRYVFTFQMIKPLSLRGRLAPGLQLAPGFRSATMRYSDQTVASASLSALALLGTSRREVRALRTVPAVFVLRRCPPSLILLSLDLFRIMYSRDAWTIECPACGVEGEAVRRADGSIAIDSNYINFCVDTKGRYIDPNTLEERMVLHCSGCSTLWDFSDPADTWYDTLGSPNDDPSNQFKHLAAPPQSVGLVYLILELLSGLHKIGWTASSDTRKRLATLQTACSSELRLVGSFTATLDSERRLHTLFQPQRVRGEWFRLSTDDVVNILSTDWRRQHFV